jgi:hypothetical protein
VPREINRETAHAAVSAVYPVCVRCGRRGWRFFGTTKRGRYFFGCAGGCGVFVSVETVPGGFCYTRETFVPYNLEKPKTENGGV